MINAYTPDEIKQIRLGLSMSITEFSRAIRCTYATVDRWEKGKSHPIKRYVKTIMRLKKVAFNN